MSICAHMPNIGPQNNLQYVKTHTCLLLLKSNIGPESIHVVQSNRYLKIYHKYKVIVLHYAFDLCSQSQESVMIWGSCEGFNDIAFFWTLRQAPSPKDAGTPAQSKSLLQTYTHSSSTHHLNKIQKVCCALSILT
jgi:hypothetical protein